MKDLWWQIDGNKISFSKLKSGDYPAPVSLFQKTTLEFGREWLNGATEFALATSGSTGPPRKITIQRWQMEASARLTENALELQSYYTALLCLDTSRIAGQMILVRSFVTGMNVIVVEPSANPFDKIPGDQRVDFVALVPYQLHALITSSSSKAKLQECKAVIIGGAPVDEQLKSLVASLRCPVYATYGMTETISHIALQRLNGPNKEDHFRTLPGIFVGTDSRGCLTITAPHLGDDAIITNDLVDVVSTDKFKWTGRVDNVINSGGVKIIPENVEREIATLFRELGLVNRFYIGAVKDRQLGSKAILIVEGAPFERHLLARIDQQLRSTLAPYEIPKEIRSIGQFVETASQKIDRRATLELIEKTPDSER